MLTTSDASLSPQGELEAHHSNPATTASVGHTTQGPPTGEEAADAAGVLARQETADIAIVLAARNQH